MVGGTEQTMHLDRRFRLLAWVVLLFTVAVIVSGDIVQATESGAGCGETWPRCDGSLIPSIGDAQTAVEFTHRIMTTVLSAGFIAMIAAVRLIMRTRRDDVTDRVWRATLWATGFFVFEVLIGALLVVFGWVEIDASIGRVVADAVHVVNTFLLVGALAMVVHYASGGGALVRRRDRNLVGVVLAVVLLIAVTGAINSLADTLYFAEGVDVAATPIASILVTIRGIHPAVAIGGGIVVFLLTRTMALGAEPGARRLAAVVESIVWVQFAVGLLNIVLLTPLETQVIHLILADGLWITFVFFAAKHLSTGRSEAARVPVVES